ncbi:hypothetical protein LBMAG44_08790 [Gemmatimonadota bacterium]|nr:hypothetical protein LBMAG44_08790 [Gemmatimonadota bacterium]
MRNHALMACAILVLPFAALSAQRGGRGGSTPSGEAPPRAVRPATASQLEDLNPARMLVDKRKKLSLADSQLSQMKALEKKITDRNAAIIAQYDSVRGEMRFGNVAPVPGSMGASMGAAGGRNRNASSGSGSTMQTPEAAAKMREQTIALRVIAMQIRERRPADLAEALALLTPEQQKRAEEFVKEQEDEVDRLISAGGRGG